MAAYICLQIQKGGLIYADVIPLYPQFKEAVDACLIGKGLGHLIVD